MAKSTISLRSPLELILSTFRKTTSALPPEIWEIITGYLTDKELFPIRCLNQLFYAASLSRRYTEVDLCRPERFYKRFRLLCTPAIASRIRILKIYADFASDVESTDSIKPYPSIFVEPLGQITTPGNARTLNRMNTFAGKIFSKHRDFSRMGQDRKAQVDQGDVFAKAVENLGNVRELQTTYCHWLETGCPFLEALLPVISNNLQSLSFHLHKRELAQTGRRETMPAFPHLKRLALQIGIHSYETIKSYVREIVQGLSIQRLEALSIEICHGDFRNGSAHALKTYRGVRSSVFDLFNAEAFWSLTSLSITFLLDFDLNTADCISLNRLLHRLKSLRDLTIIRGSSTYCGFTSDIGAWYTAIKLFEDVSFPSLETFVLKAGDGLHFIEHPLLTPLTQRGSTLKSLSVVDRYLDYDEVVNILDVLGNCQLERLSMEVYLVTPNLISLLAEKLPNLLHLTLYTSPDYGGQIIAFERDLEIELQSPSVRELYTSWRLFDISIRGRLPSEDYIQLDFMLALAKCVPAITTLSGNENDR